MEIQFDTMINQVMLTVEAEVTFEWYNPGKIDEVIINGIFARDSEVDITDVLDDKVLAAVDEQIPQHIPDGPEYEPEEDV